MKIRGLRFAIYIVFVIIISLFFCSCGRRDDLPEGARYFEPIWFDNLSEYCTGNYNRMSDFKDGYAVVSFAQMGKSWNVSDKRTAVIDKSGKIVLGLFEGDIQIDIIDNKSFHIIGVDNWTSKIVDANNNIISSFNGILISGRNSNGELFNKYGISYIVSQDSKFNKNAYGLVSKNGEIIVPCKYNGIISDITDEHIIFLRNEEGTVADVYNTDGSFSHSIYLDYAIHEYNHGLLKLHSDNSYGVANIHGDVIVRPDDTNVEIISENHIIVSRWNSRDCLLLNKEGETIKNLEISLPQTSEMYNGVFMISNQIDTCLMTSEGEVLKEYPQSHRPKYCGDGIFSIELGLNTTTSVQLIDAKTGNVIGEKYRDRDNIKFDEGYAVVEDLDGNKFVIDTKGNKFCEGYDISGNVSDRVVKIYNDTLAGIICLPRIK